MKEVELKINDEMIREGLRTVLTNDKRRIMDAIRSLEDLELLTIDDVCQKLIDVVNYIDKNNLVANLDFKSAFKDK